MNTELGTRKAAWIPPPPSNAVPSTKWFNRFDDESHQYIGTYQVQTVQVDPWPRSGPPHRQVWYVEPDDETHTLQWAGTYELYPTKVAALRALKKVAQGCVTQALAEVETYREWVREIQALINQEKTA